MKHFPVGASPDRAWPDRSWPALSTEIITGIRDVTAPARGFDLTAKER